MKTMRILPAVVLTAGIAVAAPADAAAPAVSPDDPPPEFPVSVMATVNAPSNGFVAVGIAPFADGLAVFVDDQQTPEPSLAYYVEDDGTTSAALDVPLVAASATAGPDHVVYGLLDEGTLPESSVGAVAFTGARTGEVISAAPLDGGRFIEFRRNEFVATPSGFAAADGGDVLMGLVGADGNFLPAAAVPPELTAASIVQTPRSIIDLARPQSWPLRVDAPDPEGSQPPIPAPSARSTIVWPVDLVAGGPGDETTALAVLRPGAEGATWLTIPAGWSYGGSSVWGTALYRVDTAAGTVDVARIDAAILAGDEGAPAGASKPDCPSYAEHTAEEFPFRVCETSPSIRNIQWLLVNHFGFDLVIDGQYGSRTEAAVAKFQHDHGLEVDGLTGPATWAALSGEPDSPPWTWGIPSTTTTTAPGGVEVTCDEYVDAPESYPVQPCTNGSSVFAIQVALIVASDYTLELNADGYYGPATATAVAALQRRSDLPATGQVDRATWLALDAGGGADRVDRDGSGFIDPWEWTIESSEPVG